MTPTPQWYDSPETEQMTIPVMKKGMTAFLITGDAARNKVQTMPGGGYATIKIELPENWDSLMTELGYENVSNPEKLIGKITANHRKLIGKITTII